ncbi:MAG: SWIM zinc finger family protein, partial [Planctomycetes bacterium]|nr:SWIM zinc finger family protein [Planctomycetota bacterium]
GVRVAGIERLRVLEPLAPLAERLRIFADDSSQTAAFDLVLPEARFHLVLSPDVWRGFSGEGQTLRTLAGDDWQASLPKIRAALKWDAVIDPADVARRSKLEPDAVTAALTVLGVRGLVGFDLDAGAYFHRELPFDLSLLDAHQPRLKGANKLLAEDKVRLGQRTTEQLELFVAGSGVEHRVRLGEAGPKCTCPWFSKYQGQRGPCKHILAAEMYLDRTDGS